MSRAALLLTTTLSFTLLSTFSARAVGQEEHAEELKEIIEGIANRWETLPGMTAHLTHTFEWVLAGETQTTEGTIHLADGNRFRIDTSDVILVSDGTTVWQYTPKQNQVVIDRVDPNRPNASPEQIFVAFTEGARAEWIREERRNRRESLVVIRLHRDPQEEPATVEAWVEVPRMLVVRLAWSDGAGNRHSYDLTDIEIAEQPPERFDFQIPANVVVVDMRPPGLPR